MVGRLLSLLSFLVTHFDANILSQPNDSQLQSSPPLPLAQNEFPSSPGKGEMISVKPMNLDHKFNDFAQPLEDTQSSPNHHKEIPKQKLLVKGPGYLPRVDEILDKCIRKLTGSSLKKNRMVISLASFLSNASLHISLKPTKTTKRLYEGMVFWARWRYFVPDDIPSWTLVFLNMLSLVCKVLCLHCT